MHNNKINNILKILKKHQFYYLDETIDEQLNIEFIKVEYIGKDMIYKTESDFDNIIQYNKFCNEQSNITFDKIEKGIEECNKNNIEIIDYEIDEYDYPCVYLKINLNE